MSHTFRYSGPFTEEEGRASVARQKRESERKQRQTYADSSCSFCGEDRDLHDFDGSTIEHEFDPPCEECEAGHGQQHTFRCSMFDSAYYTGSPEE